MPKLRCKDCKDYLYGKRTSANSDGRICQVRNMLVTKINRACNNFRPRETIQCEHMGYFLPLGGCINKQNNRHWRHCKKCTTGKLSRQLYQILKPAKPKSKRKNRQ